MGKLVKKVEEKGEDVEAFKRAAKGAVKKVWSIECLTWRKGHSCIVDS